MKRSMFLIRSHIDCDGELTETHPVGRAIRRVRHRPPSSSTSSHVRHRAGVAARLPLRPLDHPLALSLRPQQQQRQQQQEWAEQGQGQAHSLQQPRPLHLLQRNHDCTNAPTNWRRQHACDSMWQLSRTARRRVRTTAETRLRHSPI